MGAGSTVITMLIVRRGTGFGVLTRSLVRPSWQMSRYEWRHGDDEEHHCPRMPSSSATARRLPETTHMAASTVETAGLMRSAALSSPASAARCAKKPSPSRSHVLQRHSMLWRGETTRLLTSPTDRAASAAGTHSLPLDQTGLIDRGSPQSRRENGETDRKPWRSPRSARTSTAHFRLGSGESLMRWCAGSRGNQLRLPQ